MEKSEARALLRFVANDLRDQRAVDGYSAAIRSGEEGFMDHICWDVLEPIYALRDEFAAWEEGHTVHDYRCKVRRLLADTAMMFDEPTPEFAEEEMFNKLDVWRNLYLQGDINAKELICCLVRAIYDLRDDLIAWGRDDLTPWERRKSAV